MERTKRQRIADLLREESLSVLDIARRLAASPRSVHLDLDHVRRSINAGERWVVRDAGCESCGFVFRGREKTATPSRCPRCRSEWIRPPQFAIDTE